VLGISDEGCRRNSRFCKSGLSICPLQHISISNSIVPPPPCMDKVYKGKFSSSAARKGKKVLQGGLPKGTPSDPLYVSNSDLSAPTCKRREAKKKERKLKGGKRSDSVTNRKWQDLWATIFPWAEKYLKEDKLVLSMKMPCLHMIYIVYWK
jgi:hypothetical protein